ncbi:hypothetical protein Tco_1153053 [Tanacetum coccineum]
MLQYKTEGCCSENVQRRTETEYTVTQQLGVHCKLDNDVHKSDVLSVFHTPRNIVVNNSLNAKLSIYKEQVEMYERRAKFELTKREQKIDEQLRIVISGHNIKEEHLKKELHSVKLQLVSTLQHNKLMVDEVTFLKKDFNQKENKYLKEFLDLKALKDKVKDKLFKQGQSIQTFHMMCKPRSYYDEVNKVAIGYKNPLCLHRARQVQPALYSGHVIVTPNHAPAVVRDGEETLELTKISRKKMHDKMKANECVDNKVNITPPNYSKENFLATFTPQKQLTPEQIFWSQDIVKMKAEALKEQNTRPIKALTVYPPNTPATLVPRVLPTKSQVKINIFTLRQLFSEFEKTCKKRITPTGITEGERGFEQTKKCYLTEVIPFFKTLQEHFEGIQKALTKEVKEMSDAFDELEADLDQSIVDRKHDEIERKNLLIANDNLIADCLSKEVFYVASNSELNVSRLIMLSKPVVWNLKQSFLIYLKYQNLKDSFHNKPSSSVNDTPDFNSIFMIGQMQASLQGKYNISQLTEKVNGLQEQNEIFRAENAKIKQHYKELYDSIKITRAKHIEHIIALKNENESLKVQLENTASCVTTNQVKLNVLAPGKYAIDVEPIPPRNRNNREVHLVYLRHLKESVDTLREIVEEAKVERPLDRSLAFACHYTKHSQELLEYVFGTCPKVFNQQDKKHANTPRKKQVTFEDQIATSSSTTYKHVEPMHTQKSNVPVPPSTGVNSCTDASGSQPRSILKKHRIPPAKSDSLKKVEDHPRTIRSSLKTTNRVDSSISSKRTVINSNSHSVCQTCNKCLFSANHDMCVVTYLHSVNASPNVKNDVRHVKQVWKPKQVTQVWKPKHIKQIWKPTGKTLNNVGYQWRPTGRTFTLSDQCPLTRFTKLTGMSAIACANQSEPNQHWGSNFPNSPSSSVFKCSLSGQLDSGMITLVLLWVMEIMSGDRPMRVQTINGKKYILRESGKLQPRPDIGIISLDLYRAEEFRARTQPAPAILYMFQSPTNKELEMICQPMFDEIYSTTGKSLQSSHTGTSFLFVHHGVETGIHSEDTLATDALLVLSTISRIDLQKYQTRKTSKSAATEDWLVSKPSKMKIQVKLRRVCDRCLKNKRTSLQRFVKRRKV